MVPVLVVDAFLAMTALVAGGVWIRDGCPPVEYALRFFGID
jgi:hypothetical protein